MRSVSRRYDPPPHPRPYSQRAGADREFDPERCRGPVRNRPFPDRPRRPVRKPAIEASGHGPSSGHPFRTGSAMPRVFAYLRVSTIGQTTDNQLGEIATAGFAIEPRRVVAETVSGSVAAA